MEANIQKIIGFDNEKISKNAKKIQKFVILPLLEGSNIKSLPIFNILFIIFLII